MSIKHDVVNTGDYLDDPNSDDAYTAFSNINEAFKSVVPETGLPIADGGTGATTLEVAKQNLEIDQVDNTPDAQKPISEATQLALNDKVNKADVIAIAKGGTGATTADEARLNLQTAVCLTLDNPDFNTITEGGLYFIKVSPVSLNRPSDNWGYLSVITTPEYKHIRVIQRFVPDDGLGTHYVRELFDAVWKEWKAYKEIPADNAAARAAIGALGTGSYGLGLETQNITPETHDYLGNGFYGMNGYQGLYGYGSALKIVAGYPGFTSWQHTIFFPALNPGIPSISSRVNGAERSDFNEFLIKNVNTVFDGNGFIKSASPVVDLYADRIEANGQAKNQQISFEKLGVGDYLIKGSLGFAKTSWYVEQPKDANGNVFHAVIYDTLENGDISIKTYERKLEGVNIVADITKPVDIKENRFISIRLHEDDPTHQEPDPALLDSDGNSAPSRLHELVDGAWVISDENAATLEQERLSAMPALKRRQFRLTLAMNGYDLKEIETLIDQIEDPMQRTIAQIEWQDATDFERTNPTLLMMSSKLGLDTQRIDELWDFGLSL